MPFCALYRAKSIAELNAQILPESARQFLRERARKPAAQVSVAASAEKLHDSGAALRAEDHEMAYIFYRRAVETFDELRQAGSPLPTSGAYFRVFQQAIDKSCKLKEILKTRYAEAAAHEEGEAAAAAAAAAAAVKAGAEEEEAAAAAETAPDTEHTPTPLSADELLIDALDSVFPSTTTITTPSTPAHSNTPTSIDAHALFEALNRTSHNKVLILDVRSSPLYCRGRVKCRRSLNIPPAMLQAGATTADCEAALVTQKAMDLFHSRDQMDLIVIVDEPSSTSDALLLTQPSSPVTVLHDALFKWCASCPLAQPPRVLTGGYHEWSRLYPSFCVARTTKELPDETELAASAALDTASYPASNTLLNEDDSTPAHTQPDERKPTESAPASSSALKSGLRRKKSVSWGPDRDLVEEVEQKRRKEEEERAEAERRLLMEQEQQQHYEEEEIRKEVDVPESHGTEDRASSIDIVAAASAEPPALPSAPKPLMSAHSMPSSSAQTVPTSPVPSINRNAKPIPSSSTAPVSSPPPTRPPPSQPPTTTLTPASPPPVNRTVKPALQPSRPPPATQPSRPAHPPPPPQQPKPTTITDPTIATTATVAPSMLALAPSSMGDTLRGITGLRNLGNSCFMSAIVQCLSATLPFTLYFVKGHSVRDLSEHNRDRKRSGRLAMAFGDLLRLLWSGQYDVVTPIELKNVLARYWPQFAGYQQQDSQEFMGFLLDSLNDELNIATAPPPTVPSDNDDDVHAPRLPPEKEAELAWAAHRAREESIIVDCFQGQYCSTLQCLTCNHKSTTFSPYTFLTLPLPPHRQSTTVSLDDCIRAYTQRETIDDWRCPRCKVPRSATKLLQIWSTPPVLLISLKRFFHTATHMDKIETLVNFPISDFHVENHAIGPRRKTPYQLFGVTNHYGTAEGGHYTAFTFNVYANRWYLYDDHCVTPMSDRKIQTNAAYVLCYHCVDFQKYGRLMFQ